MAFHKNHFPAIFGGHLEFLRKMHLVFLRKAQKRIHLGNGVRESDFDKILDPQGICRLFWRHFAKITFPPCLVAILNLCVKRKTHLSGKPFEIEWFRRNF